MEFPETVTKHWAIKFSQDRFYIKGDQVFWGLEAGLKHEFGRSHFPGLSQKLALFFRELIIKIYLFFARVLILII